MKLSDAKKILSGELEYCFLRYDAKTGLSYAEMRSTKTYKPTSVLLLDDEVEFCLRQLALKVAREKEKG